MTQFYVITDGDTGMISSGSRFKNGFTHLKYSQQCRKVTIPLDSSF